MQGDQSLNFVVNGKPYSVEQPEIGTSLNEWLRTEGKLTGTKSMCNEGGCGACVVMVTQKDPASGKDKSAAVNSCLFPLLSIDGCHVTTTEGLVSDDGKYHAIQERMAHFNATQCGYCTPGFVMTMHSLLSKNPTPTQQEIEAEFDGNICRCTGFRAIFDAMKSFGSDCDPKLAKVCSDIEDLGSCNETCNKADIPCRKGCGKYFADGTMQWLRRKTENVTVNLKAAPVFRQYQLHDGSVIWCRPETLQELTEKMKEWTGGEQRRTVRFVVGNTSIGIFKNEGQYGAYCDTKLIKDLHQVEDREDALVIGANVTLAQLITVFEKHGVDCPTFSVMAKHLRKVANVPVRNVASWAGNLAVKRIHKEFPSDIFTLFEAFSVKLVIRNCISESDSFYNMMGSDGFMNLDMNGKVILSAVIPKKLGDGNGQCKALSYKVMPRSQNAQAYVNAAFCTNVKNGKISDARIVFGGISKNFTHAPETEKFLQGSNANSQDVLAGALKMLEAELIPESYSVTDSSPEYRRSLSLGLFYKFYLHLCDNVTQDVASAVSTIQRPLTTATRSYDSNSSMYPVSQPIPTITGRKQASGEAKYISDFRPWNDQLFATLVLAKVGNADIDEMDVTRAKEMPGYYAILTATDLPPELKNTFTPPPNNAERIVAESHIDYAGQPVAIVLADTLHHAQMIAEAVTVTYKNCEPVVTDLEEAIRKKMFFDGAGETTVIGDIEKALENSPNKVSGRIRLGGQYHFYMETQVARAKPTEAGFDIECATQCQDRVQSSLAYIFGWNCNRFNITTGRMGGAFGGKASNSLLTASVATVASYIAGRPVQFQASMSQCMEAFGSRAAFVADYTVGFSTNGILTGIDVSLYSNEGASPCDGRTNSNAAKNFLDGGYYCPNWRFTPHWVKTHIPSSTWLRAPGSTLMTMSIEIIMEHVAKSIGADPIEVKQKNLYVQNQKNLFGEKLSFCNIRPLCESLLDSAKVESRKDEIAIFNEFSKWKKRGIGFMPMKYGFSYGYSHYSTQVSIFHSDGSVVLMTGSSDSGQGLNTKLVQVASHVLRIPMDHIRVQDSMIVATPNSSDSSSSITSELCCQGILECCKMLRGRIDIAKNELGLSDDTSWCDLIEKCFRHGVDLTAHHWVHHKPKHYVQYNAYAAACCEVELDILTGEFAIRRVDILYDCGQSINPEIDFGQAEGGFMMGVGYYTTEKMQFDPMTGRLVTNSTWRYKPPSGKDIPTEWNIDFLKDAPNQNGILGAKAIGEPPFCLSASVVFAIKRCIEAFRKDDSYFAIAFSRYLRPSQRNV